MVYCTYIYIPNISINGLTDLTTIEENTEPITSIVEDNQPNLVMHKPKIDKVALRSKMDEWLNGMCGMEVEHQQFDQSRKSKFHEHYYYRL